MLPIEPIESHIKELAKGLSADGNDKAVNAIMTTDTVPKQYAVKFMLGDSGVYSRRYGKREAV